MGKGCSPNAEKPCAQVGVQHMALCIVTPCSANADVAGTYGHHHRQASEKTHHCRKAAPLLIPPTPHVSIMQHAHASSHAGLRGKPTPVRAYSRCIINTSQK